MLCPRCGQPNDDANQECAVCRQKLPTRNGSARGPAVCDSGGPAPAGRVNKPFYRGSIGGGGSAGVALVLLASARLQRNPTDLGSFPLLLLGEVLLMYAAAVFAVLLYKSWKAIQDGHARTSPGKAVGYLFIPVFNFYWAFQAYWGFARDYNRFVARHALDAPTVAEGLYLAACIMTLVAYPLAFVPVLKYIAPVASWVFWLLMANGMCDAVNRVAAPADVSQ